MGGKRAGKRKQIHLCIAILILCSPVACTLNRMLETKTVGTSISAPRPDRARGHLSQVQKFLARGDFGNALKENDKALSLAGNGPPADESLFYAGLIYAHPTNAAKDYGKSLLYFKRLIKDYPKSAFIEEAQTISGLLQENDKQNKMIEKLNTILEESKKVDIEIEQRKRERGK